jgi:phage-related protein
MQATPCFYHTDGQKLIRFGSCKDDHTIRTVSSGMWLRKTIYTVKIKGIIYVLHAFQKKSRKGIKTPQAELDKIKRRLKEAEQASSEREQ